MFFLTQEVHDISYSHEKNTPAQRANIQYDDKSLYISLNTEEKKNHLYVQHTVHTSIYRACYISKLASMHTIFAL